MSPSHSDRARRTAGRFWIASAALHAIVLTALLFFGPVRRIILPEKDVAEPVVTTRGDQLQSVVESIRDLTVERLRGRVGLLAEGQERMADNFAICNAHFQPFEADQRATARLRLVHYLKQTDELQQALTQALGESAKSGDPGSAISLSRQNTSRILSAQDEIRRGILLLDLQKDALGPRQQSAQEVQIEANQFLRWLDDCVLDAARCETEIVQLELRIPATETSLTTLNQEAARLQRERDDYQRRIADLDAERDRFRNMQQDLQGQTRQLGDKSESLRRDLKRLQDRNAKAPEAQRDTEGEKRLQGEIDAAGARSAELRKRSDDAGAQMKQIAEVTRKDVLRLHDEANHRLDLQNRHVHETQSRLEEARKRMTSVKDRLAEDRAKRGELLTTAGNVQNKAANLQKELTDEVRRLLASGGSEAPAPQGVPQP